MDKWILLGLYLNFNSSPRFEPFLCSCSREDRHRTVFLRSRALKIVILKIKHDRNKYFKYILTISFKHPKSLSLR